MSWLYGLDPSNVRSVDWGTFGARRNVQPGTFSINPKGAGRPTEISFVDRDTGERIVGTDGDWG
jgi:hypothetical protein